MIFVDTGYYVARIAPQDQWRAAALRAPARGETYITTCAVIMETLALLQGRGFLSGALEFLRGIRSDPSTQIVYPDAAVHAEAWGLFNQYAGAGATPVDCVSFAIMRRFRIRRAFTFDAHFKKAGFDILP